MPGERLLTVQLARHRWAICLPELAGVCELPPLRPLPGVPGPVLGLAHRHGRIVTVLDLPALLGDAPGEGPQTLLLAAPPRGQLAAHAEGELRLALSEDGGPEEGPMRRVDLGRVLAPLERTGSGA